METTRQLSSPPPLNPALLGAGSYRPISPARAGLLQQTSRPSLLLIDGTDRRTDTVTDTVPLRRRSPLEVAGGAKKHGCLKQRAYRSHSRSTSCVPNSYNIIITAVVPIIIIVFSSPFAIFLADFYFFISAKASARDYGITGVRLSVCLFVTTITK